MFELNYTKSNNDTLKNLSETDSLEIEDIQSYIPIYDRFFELNDEISNDLVLKHHYSLNLLKDVKNYNTYSASIVDEKNNERSVDVFFKYAPLLDPVKYMLGKYDNSNNELFTLPKFKSNESETHKKLLNQNNASYIDGFFVFLTSKLLHSHYFLHGVDYYGSYLCNKNNFIVDIVDDIEYLTKSSFFNDNINELFMVDETFYEKLNEGDTRSKKEAIDILDDEPVLELSDTAEIETLDKLFESKSTTVAVDETTLESNDISNSIVYDKKPECSDDDDSGSECSSRSSNTDKSVENSDEEEEESDEDSDCEFSDSEEESDDEDETLNISIQKFPVQLVCTEKCENTLDNYLMNNSDLDEEELESIILQIIMTLITYQKAFSFTHNDLHTNNVMYISTEKKYLYYKVNEKYYRVPTFGKIYKIIDFGRAIYKFRGNLLCSDSFSDEGDAASQYNFGPYLNDNKNVCEPNYSFDLCRLACSLYDFIDNDDDEGDEHTSKSYKDEIDIEKVIKSWCKDDKGRNILYKKNGEERYPDFKLYKMISRSVHNHIPEKQLERECFKTYIIGKKKLNKKTRVIDIDSIPKY
tara:strand:+ start:1575 stop:3323 length:1749 start_codon:yes stop_codon:yes gene_type:complete